MILLYMSFIEDEKYNDRFEQIYYMYRDKMMRIAQAILHNFHDAQDAVQTSFVAIAKNIDKLPEADSKATEIYVCKCAKTAALNMLPSKTHRDNFIDLNEEYALFDEASFENYISEENYKYIINAIEALPEVYRDVLSLYYVYEMKPGEIASSLGKSIETVKSQIKRGKQIFLADCKERIKV